MDTTQLLASLDNEMFTRHDIFIAACRIQSAFKETQLRNLIAKLLNSNMITRVGRNVYRKVNFASKVKYTHDYSQDALDIMNELNQTFPYMKYCVWEITWLNEFLDHLISQNNVFVEVENDGCEYVFNTLMSNYSDRLLLKPTSKEMTYYAKDNCIIIDRLITEAPGCMTASHMISIEKIIVDLFSNKRLQSMISKGDYPVMLERIFAKYVVDQTKMFRYARRRNKHKELANYISANTNINLIVGV